MMKVQHAKQFLQLLHRSTVTRTCTDVLFELRKTRSKTKRTLDLVVNCV